MSNGEIEKPENVFPLKQPLYYGDYFQLKTKLRADMIRMGLRKVDIDIVTPASDKLGPKVTGHTFTVRLLGPRDAPEVKKGADVGALWPDHEFQPWYERVFITNEPVRKITWGGIYSFRLSRVARTGTTAPLIVDYRRQQEQPVIPETPQEIVDTQPTTRLSEALPEIDQPEVAADPAVIQDVPLPPRVDPAEGISIRDSVELERDILTRMEQFRKRFSRGFKDPQYAELVLTDKGGEEVSVRLVHPNMTTRSVMIDGSRTRLTGFGGAERLFTELDVDPIRIILRPVKEDIGEK